MNKKINILSHRGYWKNKSEQNQMAAFERSFRFGFGIETDIRDYNGELVVSHDIADSNNIRVKDLFEVYNKYGANLPLALNIKSDGLQTKLQHLVNKHKISNYFVFDMSIPDTFPYLDANMSIFVRQSEYEPHPELFDRAKGVWLDQLKIEWCNEKIMGKIFNQWGSVCIVSSELHGRDYEKFWSRINIARKHNQSKLMLCTDYPLQAEEYFNGE